MKALDLDALRHRLEAAVALTEARLVARGSPPIAAADAMAMRLAACAPVWSFRLAEVEIAFDVARVRVDPPWRPRPRHAYVVRRVCRFAWATRLMDWLRGRRPERLTLRLCAGGPATLDLAPIARERKACMFGRKRLDSNVVNRK